MSMTFLRTALLVKNRSASSSTSAAPLASSAMLNRFFRAGRRAEAIIVALKP